MNPILILTNCASGVEADRIADELLNQKLATAVQIIGPTTSRYRWQDEVHQKQEWLLIIKTTDGCEEDVKTVIGELHSYELPGLLKINIDGGDERYLQWVLNNVAGDDKR